MFCSSWPLWSPPPCPGSGRRRRRSRHQSTREKEVRDKRGRWLMWQILVSKPLIPVDFPSRWNCPEEAAAKSQIYAMGRNHWIWGGIEKITCIHREQIYSVYIMYVQYKYSLKIKQKMSDFCVILSKYSHDTLSRHASAVLLLAQRSTLPNWLCIALKVSSTSWDTWQSTPLSSHARTFVLGPLNSKWNEKRRRRAFNCQSISSAPYLKRK